MSDPLGEPRSPVFPDDHPDAARLRLAEALRPLINLTVSGTPDDAALLAAAQTIEHVVAELTVGAGAERRPRMPPDVVRPTVEYFPTSPVAGVINPVAPPVILEVVAGEDGAAPEIRSTTRFDLPYEGPPNCVHGGVIAGTFDEVLGAAVMVAGHPGMTGNLTVRYRKPTPLRAELRIEARFLDREGRKIRAWAGIYHGDVLTAEADGLFIEVGPRQMLAFAEENAVVTDEGFLQVMRRTVEAVDPDGGPAGP